VHDVAVDTPITEVRAVGELDQGVLDVLPDIFFFETDAGDVVAVDDGGMDSQSMVIEVTSIG